VSTFLELRRKEAEGGSESGGGNIRHLGKVWLKTNPQSFEICSVNKTLKLVSESRAGLLLFGGSRKESISLPKACTVHPHSLAPGSPSSSSKSTAEGPVLYYITLISSSASLFLISGTLWLIQDSLPMSRSINYIILVC
jgi:hypothetical protein